MMSVIFIHYNVARSGLVTIYVTVYDINSDLDAVRIRILSKLMNFEKCQNYVFEVVTNL